MNKCFRSISVLVDAVGHIGSAVRAAEEFERSRVSRHALTCDTAKSGDAAASVPL